jgi:hypothetical protein
MKESSLSMVSKILNSSLSCLNDELNEVIKIFLKISISSLLLNLSEYKQYNSYINIFLRYSVNSVVPRNMNLLNC